MYQKSSNESITFLFIGQGQEDTWHHLRGLPDAYSSRNLEKIHFRMSPQQFRMMVQSGKSISFIFVFLERFTWLCENFAWLCEITFHVSFVCYSQVYYVSFCMTVRNWKTCFFDSSLQFLSFLSLDSTSTTSKSTPNPDPNRLHCFFHYAFGSSSTLFVFFNLIHLFCHQFIKNLPWNNFKTS